ncbi:SIR2 family protein [Catenulispora rubra]|uniref:SIR2 family protein n=1 Tax=Catenulispora rubra TaxID=280293 RepID=UPI00189246DF|nr:SIR2 family protein [Catenulispora rubra]
MATNDAVDATAPAVDHKVALATSMHGNPGMHALLLGAGISIGAGVPTGWGIVEDLVGQLAAARDPDDAGAAATAAKDPVAWWTANGRGDLGYSPLLAAIAPTGAARQGVLTRYFADPGITPSPAHRAVAELVRRRSVKVIITTNFDRLIEQALSEVGIKPQIIHSPGQYRAATPLVHSQATIIKLHGDYLDQRSLNTAEELASYPAAQKKLLDQVLDEYGLIVCGWSADWDTALVGAIEGVRSRRYPMVWSAYGTVGDKAGDLIAQHQATVIKGMTADEFFPDLVKRLEALDVMRENPISRDMAVARLKKAITTRDRIEIYDTVDRATTKVSDSVSDLERHPVWVGSGTNEPTATAFGMSMRNYRAEADTLLHLLATGAFFDDGTFDHIWVRPVVRLAQARKPSQGASLDEMEKLRHYPALLAAYTAGVAAVLARREELLAGLLLTPLYTNPNRYNDPSQSAAMFLNPALMLEASVLINPATQLNGIGQYPQSHQVRADVREPLRGIEPDDDAYQAACSRFEILASMLSNDAWGQAGEEPGTRYPWLGEYVLDSGWRAQRGLVARIGEEISENWPLVRAGAFGGDVERARAALAGVTRWSSFTDRP